MIKEKLADCRIKNLESEQQKGYENVLKIHALAREQQEAIQNFEKTQLQKSQIRETKVLTDKHAVFYFFIFLFLFFLFLFLNFNFSLETSQKIVKTLTITLLKSTMIKTCQNNSNTLKMH